MKPDSKPVRATIFTGLVFGALYAPLSLSLESYLYWPWPFKSTLLMYLAMYSLLLTRWTERKPAKIILPLILLILYVKFQAPYETKQFVICTLLAFSWIRSGICAERLSLKLLIVELTLSFGGAVLAVFLSSQSTIGISLAIWLFFLFQSLYFIALPGKTVLQKNLVPDRFEQAKRQTEKLLYSETSH
jgi:hypothetical protein